MAGSREQLAGRTAGKDGGNGGDDEGCMGRGVYGAGRAVWAPS